MRDYPPEYDEMHAVEITNYLPSHRSWPEGVVGVFWLEDGAIVYQVLVEGDVAESTLVANFDPEDGASDETNARLAALRAVYEFERLSNRTLIDGYKNF